jgi:hypothetical protein
MGTSTFVTVKCDCHLKYFSAILPLSLFMFQHFALRGSFLINWFGVTPHRIQVGPEIFRSDASITSPPIRLPVCIMYVCMYVCVCVCVCVTPPGVGAMIPRLDTSWARNCLHVTISTRQRPPKKRIKKKMVDNTLLREYQATGNTHRRGDK